MTPHSNEDQIFEKLFKATPLFNLVGSGDQSHTVVEPESFLSVYIAYHFDDLGVFTNWSHSNPPVSVFLEG